MTNNFIVQAQQIPLLSTDTVSSSIDFEQIVKSIPTSKQELFTTLFARGKVRLLLYVPSEKDDQQPHYQDEVYIIKSGRGKFYNGLHRIKFKEGDVLYVPAKVNHRFEEFSKDFAAWVLFF